MIGFIVGFIIGGNIGFIMAAVLSANKISKLNSRYINSSIEDEDLLQEEDMMTLEEYIIARIQREGGTD